MTVAAHSEPLTLGACPELAEGSEGEGLVAEGNFHPGPWWLLAVLLLAATICAQSLADPTGDYLRPRPRPFSSRTAPTAQRAPVRLAANGNLRSVA